MSHDQKDQKIKESSDKPRTSFNVYIDTSHISFQEYGTGLVSKILMTIAEHIEQGVTIGTVNNEDDEFLASYHFKNPKNMN
jgi:hypothetical protein